MINYYCTVIDGMIHFNIFYRDLGEKVQYISGSNPNTVGYI